MGAPELRNKVIDYVNNADDRLLKVLKAVAESYHENDVVAYQVNGNPVSRKEYDSELELAENEIQSGLFTSQEQLDKEVKNW